MSEQEESDHSCNSRADFKQEKIKKRMYRDGESRVLGGVCSGIGTYFNFDPVFIRILFVLLAFLGVGISIIIYMILWIVVPEAKTTAQRLEMRGVEATVSNIRKAIQEEVDEVKDSFSKLNQSRAVKEGKMFLKSAGSVLSKIVEVIGKALGIVAGSLLVAIGLLGFIVVLISIFAGSSLFQNQSIGINPEIDLPGILSFMMSPGMVNVAILLLVLILGIPLLVILFIGTKLVFNYKTNNKMIGWGAFGIWLVALISMITLTAGQFGDFRQTSTRTEGKSIGSPNCKTLTIQCGSASGQVEDNIQINNFNLISNGSEKIYAGNPHLLIESTKSTDFSVVVKKSARGNNSGDALKNIETINYKVFSNDSTLILDPFFTLENHSKWRNQELSIMVKVPQGKMVHLDPDLDQLSFDFDNINNIWNKEMTGKTWIMTQEGLALKE